jgi:hypothetical protein
LALFQGEKRSKIKATDKERICLGALVDCWAGFQAKQIQDVTMWEF